ncbi:MAG: hypothetical protein ACOX8L_00760 [Candidatus Methanomethylophilaceae archaeon]|jgi:hypothetical protein
MDTETIIESLKMHMPEVVLIVGGLLAVLIVYFYLKNETSAGYKLSVFLGLIVGVLMIYVATVSWSGLAVSTAIIVVVGGFTLVIRPFRSVNFAVILALLVMAVAYILLGSLEGSQVYNIDISFLASGWPRIIVAVVAGALTYMITNFIEEAIKIFGKLLNWWPFLMILGLICIAEGISVGLGHGSVYELYLSYTGE